MKIRKDFVTNSSSSSYIMAFKDSDDSDKYSELLKNIINLIIESDDSYETEEARVFTTKKNVKNYIKEVYGYVADSFKEIIAQDGYAKDIYEDMMKYINMGYKVIYKDIGYGDETLKNVINLMDECDDNFILIAED